MALSLLAGCTPSSTPDPEPTDGPITSLTGTAYELTRTSDTAWTTADLKPWSRGETTIKNHTLAMVKAGTISANGAVSITLTDSVPDSKMMPWVGTDSIAAGCTVTEQVADPAARYAMEWIELEAWPNTMTGNNYYTLNYLAPGTTEQNLEVYTLIYSNMDTAVKLNASCVGKYKTQNLSFNLKLYKGWNLKRMTQNTLNNTEAVTIDDKVIQNAKWVIHIHNM